MSTSEVWACRNPVWAAFTTRVVVPWVFATEELGGDVLELGSGAGANAAALLNRFPDMALTATDLDPAMLASTRSRLTRFGDRVSFQVADATNLDFSDHSFDAVVSLLMLHHVADLRTALGECVRVLRPGGRIVGYDLSGSGPTGWLHRRSGTHNAATPAELGTALRAAGFAAVRVEPGLAGLIARFAATVPAAA